MGYSQIHKLYLAKETINKMKSQPMEWEEIFSNDVTGKRLISKIYKQLIQLNKEKPKSPNNPMKKMGIGPKQVFLQVHTDGQ